MYMKQTHKLIHRQLTEWWTKYIKLIQYIYKYFIAAECVNEQHNKEYDTPHHSVANK